MRTRAAVSFTRGRADEADKADKLVTDIERTVAEQTGERLADVSDSCPRRH